MVSQYTCLSKHQAVHLSKGGQLFPFVNFTSIKLKKQTTKHSPPVPPFHESACGGRGAAGLLMRSSRLYFYISQLSQRSGCRITNILNNENVIIVEVYSLTDRRKDWHLEASLNFWPFRG